MAQPLCGAKTRAGGSCTYLAMVGGTRCRRHGGAAKQVRAAAARRVAEAKATQAIQREHLSPVDDPIAALRELAAEALGVKRYFAERVNQLEQLRYQAGAGEQVRGELLLYGQAFDRAARLCESLAKLNLDERVTRIEEANVVLLVAVLARVLASPELGLDAGRQARGRELLADALEAGQ